LRGFRILKNAQIIFILKRRYEAPNQGSKRLFILLGGIMVLAMHAGFVYFNSARRVKKEPDHVTTSGRFFPSLLRVYFAAVGYGVCTAPTFVGVEELARQNGELVRFPVHLAAAIPAIILRWLLSAHAFILTDCNGGHRRICLSLLKASSGTLGIARVDRR
jgi:general stress protein CsbA